MGWIRIAFALPTIVFALPTIVFVGTAAAADQAQKAQAAENKAVDLEQQVVIEGAKSPPAATPVITKPEVQAVDPAGTKALDDPITCLSRTIYWEAKGEGVAGMEAIANVVMNRLGHEGFPDTVCGVVTQGRERGACQFSWWCDGRPDDALDEKSYADAKEIARRALNRQLADRTHGALYFHQRKGMPKWAAQYLKTAEIGEHLFYKPRLGAAK